METDLKLPSKFIKIPLSFHLKFSVQSFRLDPTIRHTFWSLFVGGSLYYTIAHTDQNFVQRFLTLRNKKAAQTATVLYIFSITLFISMCIFNGLLLYATYFDCDPLTTKLAKVNDQLIPLLVMQIFRENPGVPGLFIAGVFAGKNICNNFKMKICI